MLIVGRQHALIKQCALNNPSLRYVVKKYYLLNKSCSSLISMGVRFRCGAQDAKELRLYFLAVIFCSAIEIKVKKMIRNNYRKPSIVST